MIHCIKNRDILPFVDRGTSSLDPPKKHTHLLDNYSSLILCFSRLVCLYRDHQFKCFKLDRSEYSLCFSLLTWLCGYCKHGWVTGAYHHNSMVTIILQWKFIPVYILPSYMVFVGLLGGETKWYLGDDYLSLSLPLSLISSSQCLKVRHTLIYFIL